MRWLLIAIAVAALLGAGFVWLSRDERAETPKASAPREAVRSQSAIAPVEEPVREQVVVPADEQRRFTEIRQAVRDNRIGEARELAREYLQAYPHGVLRADVESYTGVRLRPSGPDAQ